MAIAATSQLLPLFRQNFTQTEDLLLEKVYLAALNLMVHRRKSGNNWRDKLKGVRDCRAAIALHTIEHNAIECSEAELCIANIFPKDTL